MAGCEPSAIRRIGGAKYPCNADIRVRGMG